MNSANLPKAGIAAVATGTVAVFLGIWSLLWYAGWSTANIGEILLFLLVTFAHLVAAIIVLWLGKSRARWLLLLLTLPCAFAFLERIFTLAVILYRT